MKLHRAVSACGRRKRAEVRLKPGPGGPNDFVDPLIEQLCLACGLCCSGVLFKDLVLTAAEAAALRSARLPVAQLYGRARLRQPCPALDATHHCRIYPQRPGRCRQFECRLLQRVRSGQLQPAAALQCIEQTRQGADRVRRLLRLLGDHQEDRALLPRVKALQRRLERHPPDEELAAVWAALTQAMHELTLQLQRQFYP